MELLLIVFVLLAAVALISSRNRRQLSQQHQQAIEHELVGVRKTAEEDVTLFGEDLQRLDADLAGCELDEGARADYQRALDDYESAKSSLAAVTKPDEIKHVTEILEDGRYAVACVRARVSGEPLPVRRPPCFFNPQHGPSVRDVLWTPDRGAPRDVPACALDAERVEQGAEPDSRKVLLGAQRVPYWQAGPAYAPWTAGYFGATGVMPALFMGTMMGMAFGGFGGGFADGGDYGAEGGDFADGGFGDGGWGGGGFDAGGFDF